MARLLPSMLSVVLSIGWAAAVPTSRSPNAGTFTIDTTRNPNYAPNGPREYARALAKWQIEIPETLAKFGVNRHSGDVAATPFADDREYLSTVGIGTPPQNITVDLDTGSSDFWVYSSETAQTDLGNRVRWEPAKSSTAEKIPNSTWWIQYGDSSYAYGNVWRDTVTIADISVPGAVVESAMDVSFQLSTDEDLCGIFGLAIGLNSRVIPSQPTVINSMKPLLDAQVFTSDLKWHAEGTYSFGGIDSSQFTGDIRYVPLHENAKYWEINVTGVHIGDASVWYLFNWSSIVDTGTSLLLMDDDVVKAYYNAAPAAYYKAKYDAWVYPCDTVLPDLELGFSHDNTVKIPGRYINYTALEGTVCMGGLQSNIDQGFSVLGDIFLKAVFAVFDYDGRRVGFANKVLN